MAAITPDVSSRLKPDFIVAVELIYREFCNLQPGTKVLIVSDARTPDYILATYQGLAQVKGAEVVRMECQIPAGGATYQPGVKWSSMFAAAAKEADLIIDMAVGYSQIMVDVIANGGRILCPGDGTGGSFMDDVLLRTLLHTDIHAIRRHADRIAERFTNAKTCTVLTGNDELILDITGVDGAAGDGFLWDPDKNEWKAPWAFLPPAQPGVLIPKGIGNGSINVDGTLLYHPDYHEKPDSPLRLTFKDGKLVDIDGDPILANRLRNWLEDLGDEGAYYGPVHLNIGINPNALQTQSQEWERVYGSITCGMGDLSLLGTIIDNATAPILNQSAVHWDWTVLQPKILLDGVLFSENGKINY